MFIHLSLKYVGSLGLHQPLILRFLFAAGKTTKNTSPQEKKPTIPMTHLGLPDGPQSPRVTCLPSCFALASSSRERTWRRIVTSARAAEERRELNAFQWRHGIALCDQNGFMKIGIYIYISWLYKWNMFFFAPREAMSEIFKIHGLFDTETYDIGVI